MQNQNQDKSYSKEKWIVGKNIRKVLRTILQFVIIIILGYQLVNALVTFKHYIPADSSQWTNREGFISISYFGIARSTTSDHVSKRELESQLQALSDHGYETISQQNIIDFYTKDAPLPDKALFLAFEDGRNDSALFSSKKLEQLNYQATMLTYADKMGNDKEKFLQPKELLSMKKNGFWELGSNGYRLAYINILNKDKEYFPLLDHATFTNKRDAYYYNHYLMDFIRNEYDIPIEGRQEMQERLHTDYDLMESIYEEKFGFIPKTYMIMHADSLYNGMNPFVEEVNDIRIKDMFELHFNREGKMYNTNQSDRFDLTRVQPAPYWRTNHLLMKLQLDTGQPVQFKVGNENQAAKWTIKNGVAQFDLEDIILTTQPNQKATMTVNDLQLNTPFSLEVTIGGHSAGIQTIALAHSADDTLTLQIRLEGEHLYLEYCSTNGTIERVASVRVKDTGIADIPIKISIQDGNIHLSVNNNTIVQQEAVLPEITNWNLVFGAESLHEENRWEDDGEYIYDSIFKHLHLVNLDENGETLNILFSNKLVGISKLQYSIKTWLHDLIDWSIEMF